MDYSNDMNTNAAAGGSAAVATVGTTFKTIVKTKSAAQAAQHLQRL